MDENCTTRAQICDERFARDKERIGSAEVTIRELSAVSIKLSLLIDQHDKALINQNDRISKLEDIPRDKYNKVAGWVMAPLLSAIISFVIAMVLRGG